MWPMVVVRQGAIGPGRRPEATPRLGQLTPEALYSSRPADPLAFSAVAIRRARSRVAADSRRPFPTISLHVYINVYLVFWNGSNTPRSWPQLLFSAIM